MSDSGRAEAKGELAAVIDVTIKAQLVYNDSSWWANGLLLIQVTEDTLRLSLLGHLDLWF